MQALGQCRKRSPVILSFGIIPRQNKISGQVEPQPMADTYFPLVTDEIWCGEWEVRPPPPRTRIALDKMDVAELEGTA